MEISPKFSKSIYKQEYTKKSVIDGVSVIDLIDIVSEEGSLVELLRLDGKGVSQVIPGFRLLQINYSKLSPGGVKAWHVHYKQDDLWYVTNSTPLVIGLVDLRMESPTLNATMRLVLGGCHSKLLYIPRGIAHGVANLSSKTGEIIYLLNQHFSVEDTDENRLPWDFFGKYFWEVQKG